jgi:hypothetical protein
VITASKFFDSIGLEPDAWQRRVVMSDAARLIVKVDACVGATTACAAAAVRVALTKSGSRVLIVGAVPETFKPLRHAAMAFLRRAGALADVVLPGTVLLTNGSIISMADAIWLAKYRGQDLVVIDKAEWIADSTIERAAAMVAPGGRFLVSGTHMTDCGWFHREWTAAEGWEMATGMVEDCPRIAPPFLCIR